MDSSTLASIITAHLKLLLAFDEGKLEFWESSFEFK